MTPMFVSRCFFAILAMVKSPCRRVRMANASSFPTPTSVIFRGSAERMVIDSSARPSNFESSIAFRTGGGYALSTLRGFYTNFPELTLKDIDGDGFMDIALEDGSFVGWSAALGK